MNIKNLIIVVFIIGSNSCNFETNRPKLQRYETDKGILEEYYKDSLLDGESKFYTPERNLSRKYTYRKGLRHGISINYFLNGHINDSSFYSNGLKGGYHYVFDSSKNLEYKDYYFHGQSLGPQYFYKNGKIEKYVFNNFDHHQLYEGLYDSSGTIYRYGGEIVNSNLYKAKKDNVSMYGIFIYLLNPPGVNIRYTLGVIEKKSGQKNELVEFDNSRVFIDSLVMEPLPGWNYYVAGDYSDSVRKYNKVFINVLAWNKGD